MRFNKPKLLTVPKGRNPQIIENATEQESHHSIKAPLGGTFIYLEPRTKKKKKEKRKRSCQVFYLIHIENATLICLFP